MKYFLTISKVTVDVEPTFECLCHVKVVNKPSSTQCEHPKAGLPSIMNHCENLKSVKVIVVIHFNLESHIVVKSVTSRHFPCSRYLVI
jgi:hypothetical protein